jgi:hypothetical protein
MLGIFINDFITKNEVNNLIFQNLKKYFIE